MPRRSLVSDPLAAGCGCKSAFLLCLLKGRFINDTTYMLIDQDYSDVVSLCKILKGGLYRAGIDFCLCIS